MMTKAIKAIALAFALTVGSAYGTVTLQFSQIFTGGIASGFSTQGGATGVDGLRWGIIVDTTGNGFSNGGTNYDNIVGGPTAGGFLNIGEAAVTDDYFIPASALTADYSFATEGDGLTAGGKGTIDEIANIALTGGVSLGDKFALIWFDGSTANDGDYYGFFTDNSFTLPADGSTTPYDTPFVGADPVRNATSQFGAVPEPSRILLLGLAMIGLVFRRRR